ncbi:MAG TPA: hypothetical protein VH641_08875 [Streptosporangiaceae bacterium]|jgi:hypothetical protein
MADGESGDYPGTAASEAGEGRQVQRAFRLGWHFAQLYHDPHRASPDVPRTPARLPPHLPAQGQLSVPQRTTLLMREIANDVIVLDVELPSDLKIPEVRASVTALGQALKEQGDTQARQIQILQAYTRLRVDLGAADPHLGTALDLGRILADTVILPETAGEYQAEFGKFRLANVYGFLEDLHAYFPKYAADTVKGSLEIWQGWMSEHAGSVSGEEERVKRLLNAQGEKWRRILSGEILAQDLLTADDYRDAATYFLRRLRSLIWDYTKRFWPVGLPLALVTAAIIAAIAIWAPSGAASVWAVIATVAGTLGVSWKTVSSTLGRVASNAEQPLWNAEVQEAIVLAATRLPAELDRATIMSMRQSARVAQARLGRPAAPTGGEPASQPAPAAEPAGGAAGEPVPRPAAEPTAS